MGKYRNDSLKMSVNAVLTKSLINGRTNGKPGFHILFMRKSAVFSVNLSKKLCSIDAEMTMRIQC